MSEHHTILGGKVHVYKRPNSSSWQCATYLAGKNRRTTTKEDSLSKAKEFAEDWYLQLRGKLRDGELVSGKPFRDAAKLYLRPEQYARFTLLPEVPATAAPAKPVPVKPE